MCLFSKFLLILSVAISTFKSEIAKKNPPRFFCLTIDKKAYENVPPDIKNHLPYLSFAIVRIILRYSIVLIINILKL